jgi:ABC-type antimicrobial peptide transport system permease subunit
MANAMSGEVREPGVRRGAHVDALLGQLRAQQRAFLAVAALALAISALGILAQMLISATVVGIVAAGVAITAAAVGLQVWVPQQISPASAIDPPSLPWDAVVWGLAAGIGTTLVGAALPAAVAARLDIALALRD